MSGRPASAPSRADAGSPTLFDMHCHLDFFAEPAAVAAQAAKLGLGILAVGVEPGGYESLARKLAEGLALRLAVGAHPWWVAGQREPSADAGRACELAARCRYLGEVGLDFSERGTLCSAHGKARQIAAFEQIATACAAIGGKVLSIHAVRSAGTALDILERTGVIDTCACILHWFSGSGEELARAVRAGAWFSMNERQLATRRGREYARQIPARRLLLESDLPAEDATGAADAADLRASLERALAMMAQARGESPQELRRTLAASSARLLEGGAEAVCA